MKKLLGILALLFASVNLHATTLSGTVLNATNTTVPNAKVVFTLGNCSGTPSSLNASGIPPLSVNYTADSNGTLSGTILGNDQIACDNREATWYVVSAYTPSGQLLYTKIYSLTDAIGFNLQSSTALSDISTTHPNFLYNPMTTLGDLLIGGTAGYPTRLAMGGASTCLTSNGVSLGWVTCSAGSGTASFPSSPGLVYSTNVSSGRNATAADITNLFGSGSCSGYLNGNGTCSTPATPAIFPTASAVVVNTSTTASRNATSADIVTLFGSGSCVGYLLNDGTCSVPTASVTGAQYHLMGFVGSGSGSNYSPAQLNYTTDSTFSDILGVRNLSTTGATTIVATDPTSNSASPTAYHSIAETTSYTLNSPGVNDISRTVIFGGPGGKNYGASNGPGNGVTGTPWTNSGNMYMNATFNRRGITQWLSGNATKYGTGDFGGIYLYPTCAGGLTGTSDEGCTAISLRYGQTNYTFSGTAASSASTGTTSLAHTAGQTCDGCYWVDQKTSYASGHFTAVATAATGYYYFSEPIDTTVTPSTAYGNLACQGGLPELVVQTTPELVTCNVTNILGSTGVFTAGSTVTLSGGWTEQVTIVSPGTLSGTTQSGITFYHRNPNITNWAPGAYQLKTTIDDGTYIQAVSVAGTSGSTVPTWNHTVGGTTVDGGVTWTNIRASSTSSISMLWQGGPQGMVQCQDYLLAISGKAMCEPVFGAPDSTHLAAGLNVGGGLATPQTGIFASQALNTLTVSGTTVTGIPNTSTLGPSFNSLTSVLISGCSDATLNGVGTNAVYNANGTVSWTYPGGSTLLGCSSASINLPSSYAAFHMYPYAEQISPYDGTVNSTLEPNNVAWASGDPLIQPNPPSWSGAGIWQTSTINNTSAGTNSSSMLLDGVGAGISNGYTFIHTRNLNPESMYAGGGGVLNAPILMNLYGPNSGIGITEPMPGNTALSFNCRISGCTNLLVPIMYVGGAANSGSMTFNPLTGAWVFSPTISAQNMSVTSTATLANAAISNMTVTGTATYSAGLTISNTDSQVRWLTFNTGSNVNSFGLCSRYSSGFNDMCFGASNDTVNGLYAATGNVWGNSFHGNAIATFNGIQSSLGAPVFSLTPVYTGTAGVMTATYGLQAVAPLGTTIVGASRTITLLGTLGGSNSVNIPCPTALQVGYPTGTTYVLWKIITGGTTGINLGTCTLSSSVTDNGSVTTVTTLPTYSSNQPVYAGRFVDNELGTSTAVLCGNGVNGTLTTSGCTVSLSAITLNAKTVTGVSGTGGTLVSTSGTATAGHITTWTSTGDIADSGTVLTNVPLKNTTNSFTAAQTFSSGLVIGGSSTITGVQGTTGTLLAAVTGSFITNNLRSTDSSGNEVDSGIPASIKGTGSSLMSATGTFTQGNILTVNAFGTLIDSGSAIANIPFINQTNTFTSQNTMPALVLSNFSATCSVSTRGLFNYVAGGAGVKDIVQVCAKDASDTYAFRAIY